jgi:hypothetical protein
MLQYREKALLSESVPEWADLRLSRLESELAKVKDSLQRLKFLEVEARSLESALLSD